MKVCIKFPWKFVDSPYYTNLINYPPENVNFLGFDREKVRVIISHRTFVIRNMIKKVLRRTLELFKIPNITFTPSNADLVHCAHCLLLNRQPWVVDLEHYWSLSVSDKISYSKVGKFLTEKMLRREYCKKIMPWTHAAENAIKEVIKNRDVLQKVEVVYPAVPIPDFKRKSNKITLLFIGRYFYPKGGLFVLEAFKRLRQRYDIECAFISLTIPEQLKQKYKRYIKIYNSVSDAILFEEIYPSSDIFVYPGFSDTFGFALLEAMSFELPIVTVDSFAREEIVKDGKNGFVIEKPNNINFYNIGRKEEDIIESLVKMTSLLIEDSNLRKRMGLAGYRMVENGKFSIKQRNKKLKRIYEEALRK